jgi:hypothetical protein
MWHALRTLADRSAIYDMPLLNALRWWENVFCGCLRKANANALKKSSSESGKLLSNDGSSSSVIQPSSSGSEAMNATAETSSDSIMPEHTGHDTDVDDEVDLMPALQLPTATHASHLDNNSVPGSNSQSEHEDGTHPTSSREGRLLNEDSGNASPIAPRADARNMMEFAARHLPENVFCLALVQSVYQWFDQPSGQLLVAAFHMSWAGTKGLEQPDAASMFCDMLSQRCPTLQPRSNLPARKDVEAGDCQTVEQSDASSVGVGSSDQVHLHAQEWMNSQLLGTLCWLERHIQDFQGLHEHATKEPASFFQAATHSQPFNHLPPPFNHRSTFQRLLLTVALQPNALHAGLEWYIMSIMQHLWPSGVPSNCAPLDRCAGIAQAMHSAPSTCCPILLHSNVPHAAISTVHNLLSIHRNGTDQLNVPASRTLQLLAAEAKGTPRRAQTSLVVVHASNHLHASAVLHSLSCAATDGHWVLLTCAHLRPDIVRAVIRLSFMLQDNNSASPHFRIMMSCPSYALPTIPLRASILSVMCGEDELSTATSLLRAVDSPLGDNIPLTLSSQRPVSQFAAGSPESQSVGGIPAVEYALSPAHLMLLQTLAIRAAVAIAQVESRMRSSHAHAAFICTPLPLITPRDFLHALWCIHEAILLAPDSKKFSMSNLRTTIVQVCTARHDNCHGKFKLTCVKPC